MEVVLCPEQGLLLLHILLIERHAKHRVSKTVASLPSLQSRHDVVSIRSGADEKATLAEIFGGVAEHAVGLWQALEAVVEGELATDKVELLLRILVKVSRTLLLFTHMILVVTFSLRCSRLHGILP